MSLAPDKVLSSTKMYIFFLFLHENICCGYSLEVPQLGASNEYRVHTGKAKSNSRTFQGSTS